MSPLEVTESTKLKLTINATRRALWHTKLGFQRSPAFAVSLHSLVPTGGIVPSVEVVLHRKYPILHMEACNDGSKIIRDQNEEEEAIQNHYVFWIM